ncbi:MAG TPA: IS110 family transposase [Allosphingosinicella sp.]
MKVQAGTQVPTKAETSAAMSTGTVWVGLDVGEERTSICVLDEAGEPLHESSCQTTAEDIEQSLSAYSLEQIELVALEAGSVTHLVRKLRLRGYPVDIFEARKASKFLAIRRSKTDASDARGLADLARLGRSTISRVHLATVEFQQLRSELMLRQQLIRVRVAIELGIRSRLRLYGRTVPLSRVRGAVRQSVDAETAALVEQEGIDLRSHLAPLVNVSESLRDYVRDVDKELEKRARDNPVCRLLMEIPGVGPLCALSFYAAIEDPDRFRRPRDVAAYLGLVPRRYQSGDLSFSMGITKTGNKLARKNLVTAAIVMRGLKTDCALRDWHMALRERRGAGRAKVAVARKLAILMLIMWRTGAHFEPYPGRGSAQGLSGCAIV